MLYCFKFPVARSILIQLKSYKLILTILSCDLLPRWYLATRLSSRLSPLSFNAWLQTVPSMIYCLVIQDIIVIRSWVLNLPSLYTTKPHTRPQSPSSIRAFSWHFVIPKPKLMDRTKLLNRETVIFVQVTSVPIRCWVYKLSLDVQNVLSVYKPLANLTSLKRLGPIRQPRTMSLAYHSVSA